MSTEPDYRVELETHGDYILIRFVNYTKLDLYNVRDLVEAFKEQNEKGNIHIAVDLSTIEYIDSSGLGALASQGNFLVKKGTKLNLLTPSSGVMHLFRAGGFNKFFTICTDLNSLT